MPLNQWKSSMHFDLAIPTAFNQTDRQTSYESSLKLHPICQFFQSWQSLVAATECFCSFFTDAQITFLLSLFLNQGFVYTYFASSFTIIFFFCEGFRFQFESLQRPWVQLLGIRTKASRTRMHWRNPKSQRNDLVPVFCAAWSILNGRCGCFQGPPPKSSTALWFHAPKNN